MPRRIEPAVIVCDEGSSGGGDTVGTVAELDIACVTRTAGGGAGTGAGDVAGRHAGTISVRSIGSGSRSRPLLDADEGVATGAVGAGAIIVPPLARAEACCAPCGPRFNVGTASSESVIAGIEPVPHSAGRGSSNSG